MQLVSAFPSFDGLPWPAGHCLALLQLVDPENALAPVRAALACSSTPHEEIRALLAEADWRPQLVGAAALALQGGNDASRRQLWRAIDGASWVVPQLVAAAFCVDPTFEQQAEQRLLGADCRPPKTIGSLVRAYHRLPAPRMMMLAELARLQPTLGTEEARVGARAVDSWLDRLPVTRR